MKKTLVKLGFFCATCTFVFANPQTGCGLGDMVIKNPNSALLYAFNWTTNNTTFGLQTFAISSGTLGCARTDLVYDDRVIEFVADNMDSLSKEIAKGDGESLDALVELLEVDDKEDFKARLQAHYNSIYANKDVKMNDILDSIASLS